jgi:hypothetical protein
MNTALAISTLVLVFVSIWFSLELSECRKQLKWLQRIKGTKEDGNV